MQKNAVYSWGDNNLGQLGIDLEVKKQEYPLQIQTFEALDINIIQVSCSAYHSLFVSDIGKVYGCGSNSCKELGMHFNKVPTTTPYPIQIANIEE
mmetsp:Transcript_18790/g.17930  ORF Transcript_18790/g.17930 Transcript_18790/m.17930 type:complete len:95 (+) Transcript_18790:683-967(+)